MSTSSVPVHCAGKIAGGGGVLVGDLASQLAVEAVDLALQGAHLGGVVDRLAGGRLPAADLGQQLVFVVGALGVAAALELPLHLGDGLADLGATGPRGRSPRWRGCWTP